MLTKVLLSIVASLSVVGPPTAAQTAKIYAGATLDANASTAATATAAGTGTQAKIFTTPDGFEKVNGFYAGIYHSTPCGQPPSGAGIPKIDWACYTVDGAKDLSASKEWLKVQRPYIGNKAGSLMPDFSNVRQETVITLLWK
jgi:hypothetical protein